MKEYTVKVYASLVVEADSNYGAMINAEVKLQKIKGINDWDIIESKERKGWE